MAAGAEVYGASLTYYQAVKGAARVRVPGAEPIAADLGERFPGRRRSRTVSPDESAARWATPACVMPPPSAGGCGRLRAPGGRFGK